MGASLICTAGVFVWACECVCVHVIQPYCTNKDTSWCTMCFFYVISGGCCELNRAWWFLNSRNNLAGLKMSNNLLKIAFFHSESATPCARVYICLRDFTRLRVCYYGRVWDFQRLARCQPVRTCGVGARLCVCVRARTGWLSHQGN